MSKNMHLKGRHTNIQLVADMARLGSLCTQHTVCLFVAGQVRTGSKVFTTFLTKIFLFLLVLMFGSSICLVQRFYSESFDT